MKCVTRKPSLGAGRFSKSIAGVCSLTVRRSSYASGFAVSVDVLLTEHRDPLPEPLSQSDDDALRATRSSTVNMMRRMPSAFAGAFSGSTLTAAGEWNLRQLNPAVAVRGPHHGDVRTDAVEP